MWVLLIVFVGLNGEKKLTHVEGFKTDTECIKVARQKTAGVKATSTCLLVSTDE